MENRSIRNICIIAHIDHGKSTLADRMLEICGAVSPRDMREQYLDSMDLERERGITIKLQSVRLSHNGCVINLIDTPGHVDFGYEVSRSLAACEGAILLVDAAQGIEAQTLANCYHALDRDLEIVAALNKIDLPAADIERSSQEIEQVLGIPTEEILHVSGKTGEGVEALLDEVIRRIPAPVGDPAAPLQALVFDSHFDQYRGVISSVRVMNGELVKGSKVLLMQSGTTQDALEVGVRLPAATPVEKLTAGEVGYLVAGVKNVSQARSGETVTTAVRPASSPLDGYQDPKPMVFCGLYPIDGDDYPMLRDAMEKLRLNDASFSFEPESSTALGFGFRCGFLGLLHMEIVHERLHREFAVDLVATTPSVKYLVTTSAGEELHVDNPSQMPPAGEIASIAEPYLAVTAIAPADHAGTLMKLCQDRRGEFIKLEYLSPDRVELAYRLPLGEVITDFFDQVKGKTQGYASLDYEPAGYAAADLQKVDVLLQHEPVDAFSAIVHRDAAYDYGRRMCKKLSELIPRQQFDVPIQATIGGRIIARETVKAYRKDVTAKLYGGDVTRKRKLLEKQKSGKKRMKSIGRVEVPQEAFVSALRLD